MADSVNLMLVDLQKSDPEYARVLKGFTGRLQRSPNIVKVCWQVYFLFHIESFL